jgi:uncharacterized protein (TIGR03435 family)
MNPIALLKSQPWVERLGWTLLDFIWQGVLISAFYAAARTFAARTPNARYLLACVALAAMLAAPVATWIALGPANTSPAAVSTAPATARPAGIAAAAFTLVVAGTHSSQFLPWVVALWLLGTTALSMRLAGSCAMAMRLASRRQRPAPPEWIQALAHLQKRIGESRAVRLAVSPLVQAPAVIGWLRPAILMPVGALAGLPAAHIEALLLHELAHIRRHDYLINLLQSAAEALLFYHPAVWWISGHMRAERELCCDDAAVQWTGNAFVYASALLKLESARPAHLQAVAANGGVLRDRIARVLGQPPRQTPAGPGLIALAALPVLAACALFAQSAARPEFAVASVKPSTEQRVQFVRPQPGGRLTANASLRLLIQNAYSLQTFQIAGGPSWIESERYTIEAKAEGEPDRAHTLAMLQPLLEQRFQLKTHHETRELPVYALAPTRGGPKLAAPKPGACANPDPSAPPAWQGGRMQPPGRGAPQPMPCGSIRVMLESSGARMVGGSVMMPELIKTLSMLLSRSVIDKTAFTSPFDVQLDFVPDDVTAAMPPPPPGSSPDTNIPSILVALQEQLGLKLESTKGPVDVLVIDRVERPSGN